MVNLVKVMTLLNSIRQVNNNVIKITYEKIIIGIIDDTYLPKTEII